MRDELNGIDLVSLAGEALVEEYARIAGWDLSTRESNVG
jgi:hypothetical protein